MSRLDLHIDQMNAWHRLKRKLRARQPLGERDYSMLVKVVMKQELNPNTDILLSKLACQVTFSKNDYKCYLKILVSQEGKVFPTVQQIENYKRAYWQYLCTQLVETDGWKKLFSFRTKKEALAEFDITRYWKELCENTTMHSFADGVVRFELKFIEPIKELYRN